MSRLPALALLCVLAAPGVHAGDLDQYQRETKSRFDPRVKIVEYNPLAIVTISTVVGGLIVSVMTALLSVTQLVG